MLGVYSAVTGVFVENTYFLIDESTRQGAVVDPGQGVLQHLEKLGRDDVSWTAILVTHAHFDHIMGLKDFRDQFKAQVFLHHDDLELYSEFPHEVSKYGYIEQALPEPDHFWEDGDLVCIGDSKLEVIHTPGHTPGSVCLKTEKAVFTGDTLLFKAIGTTDHLEAMEAIQHSVKQKLFSLPEEYVIYPGHLKPSTIGAEKQFNLQLH